METLPTTTRSSPMDLGGGNFLPCSNTINSFTITQGLCWEAYCKRNGRYLSIVWVLKWPTLSEQLWLTFASVLATFNIEKAKDKDGNEIPISDEFKDYGLIRYLSYPLCPCIHGLDVWYLSSHTPPFECSITPRSPGHRQLIEEANIWTNEYSRRVAAGKTMNMQLNIFTYLNIFFSWCRQLSSREEK